MDYLRIFCAGALYAVSSPIILVSAAQILWKQRSLPDAVSKTGLQVISIKAALSVFQQREDKVAELFMKHLEEFYPWRAALRVYSIASLIYSVTGVEGLFDRIPEEKERKNYSWSASKIVSLRICMIDELIQDEVYQNNCSQILVFGAGFDTTAYQDKILMENKKNEKKIKVFELDKAATQKMKKKLVKQAGFEHSHVAYIEAELGKDTWVDKLMLAGFDTQRKTIILFEGLAYYIQKDDVQETFLQLAKIVPEGCKLLFDFPFLNRVSEKVKSALRKKNEPWLFDLESEQTIESCTQVTIDYVAKSGWNLQKLELCKKPGSGAKSLAIGCAVIAR